MSGGGSNFSREWNVNDPGFDARAVAADVAEILRNVYGTDPGRELEIETILE